MEKKKNNKIKKQESNKIYKIITPQKIGSKETEKMHSNYRDKKQID